jgi:hypothetical protein
MWSADRRTLKLNAEAQRKVHLICEKRGMKCSHLKMKFFI